MKDSVVPYAFRFFQVDCLKDLDDFVGCKISDELFLGAFLGDILYGPGDVFLFGIYESDHFGKRFDGGQTLISSPGAVVSLIFNVV